MKDKEIIEKVAEAISQLQKENNALQIGASERSFAHRLAVHMEGHFNGWNIDCEYNRQGNIPKELSKIRECDEERTTDLIYPDIIIHKRGDQSGLVIVEAKKSSSGSNDDKRKLKLYKAELGYPYAFFIIFPIKKSLTDLNYEQLIKEVE